MDDKMYIYYVVTDRRLRLMPNDMAFDCKRYESVIGVDMYWGCEKFSDISEQNKLGHIEVSVYDFDEVHFGARLEKKFIENEIKSFNKYVLGNKKLKCTPKPIKN